MNRTDFLETYKPHTCNECKDKETGCMNKDYFCPADMKCAYDLGQRQQLHDTQNQIKMLYADVIQEEKVKVIDLFRDHLQHAFRSYIFSNEEKNQQNAEVQSNMQMNNRLWNMAVGLVDYYAAQIKMWIM